MERARVTSVIWTTVLERGFWFFNISNVRVGVAECYLQIFVGMLVSRIGGGPGPPSLCGLSSFLSGWCVLHDWAVYGGVSLTGAVLSFMGSCFNTVSNILLLFDVCLSLIWLPFQFLYIYVVVFQCVQYSSFVFYVYLVNLSDTHFVPI